MRIFAARNGQDLLLCLRIRFAFSSSHVLAGHGLRRGEIAPRVLFLSLCFSGPQWPPGTVSVALRGALSEEEGSTPPPPAQRPHARCSRVLATNPRLESRTNPEMQRRGFCRWRGERPRFLWRLEAQLVSLFSFLALRFGERSTGLC